MSQSRSRSPASRSLGSRSLGSRSLARRSLARRSLARRSLGRRSKSIKRAQKTQRHRRRRQTPSAEDLPLIGQAELADLKKQVARVNTAPVYLTGSAKIVLIPNMGVPLGGVDTVKRLALEHMNLPNVTTGLMSLSDGTIYSVGFFSLVRESYAKRLSRWQNGDVIEVEYTGNLRARLFSGNYFLITNITRNQYILGDKLAPMY